MNSVPAGAGGSVAPSRFDNPMTKPVHSASPPAPINGGTLLIARDGRTPVAAQTDRDPVSIADLLNVQVLGTIELEPGSEPGRSVEDNAGRVHVVLRRSGEVASISLASRNLIERRAVCRVPQGIAYDESHDELLVACSEGELVGLPAAGGEPSHRTFVDRDLRDVVMVNGNPVVSRFKSAELLALDSAGNVVQRSKPGVIGAPVDSIRQTALGMPTKSFDAVVAWRTLALADGRVLMLHQRAQSTAIALAQDDPHAPQDGLAGAGGAAGEFASAGSGGSTGSSNPYGGSDNCDSIVRPALSANLALGGELQSGPVLPAATLAVDAAVSHDGRWVAVAVAGSRSVSDPMLGQIGAMVMQVDGWTVVPSGQTGKCQTPGLDTNGAVMAAGQVVAVGFDGMDRLVMQTREPNLLRIVTPIDGCIGCQGEADMEIELGGQPRSDTGHDLFHDDAGAGLACASCHPAGGDDGHTWVFDTIGARRTQLFNMGIENTLPLHWDGEFASFNQLVAEVFVRRMGGPELDADHVSALQAWIDTLRPNRSMRSPDDEAAQRGKALFESQAVGCSGCHNGELLTNNASMDVGTGGRFQVPSLIGVAYHQPYLHDGCAQTLRDRFDPSCGGAAHGNLQGLSSSDIDDLVAYLESL
jgi:cytochrome c553